MEITKDPLNNQAEYLTEAEGLIRLAVKQSIFRKITKSELDKKISEIIRKYLEKIKIPSLKKVAAISLTEFYHRERRKAEQLLFSSRLLLFMALSKLLEDKNTSTEEKSEFNRFMTLREARAIVQASPYLAPDDKQEIYAYGNALNIWHERYMKDYVRPVLDAMSRDKALDPESEEYLGRRSTLRNRAEREVRYQFQIDTIEQLKKSGVRLVICSSHANCSDRCRPWQGRVYSLDNTEGTTPDGRPYIPLEEATNILTPNGKWFNGLLGFNCRHYLVPYKDGYKFPKVSARTEEAQYRIDQKQRYMERKVREWRIKAEMYKGIDAKGYAIAKRKADIWNKKYISFSHANGRAYFRSRTRII